jgi:hypothetical protein
MDQNNRPPGHPFRQPYTPQDNYVPRTDGGWERPPGASVVDEAYEWAYDDDDAPIAGGARARKTNHKRKANSAQKATKKPSSASPFVTGMTYRDGPNRTLVAALETVDPSLHPSGALPQPPLDGAPPAARLLLPQPSQGASASSTSYGGPQRPLTGERARAREAKVAARKANVGPTNFTEAQTEDDARVEVAYMDWLLNAPIGQNSELHFWREYKGFAKILKWVDHLGRPQVHFHYPGKERYARRKHLRRLLAPEEAPLVGKAAALASIGLDGTQADDQRAALQRAAAGQTALDYEVFGTDSEGEGGAAVEEEEAPDGETAGPYAPQFYVYQVENARSGENIAERKPTREEVERAIVQGKHAGGPMTWASIVEHFALPAFTKGSSARIRRDVLPLALKHGGVVVLRQRADGKGRKGFLYTYMAPWIDRAAHRALHVERRLEGFRAEQAENARAFDRFGGTAWSGAASTRGRLTALEESDLAHAQYDGIEAKFEAEEARASEARAQQSAAAVRQLKADAEAIQKAVSQKTRRVVRATAASDDDDAGDVSDDGR